MIQSTNSHVRRLLTEKVSYEEELQRAKELMKGRMQGLLIQCTFQQFVFRSDIFSLEQYSRWGHRSHAPDSIDRRRVVRNWIVDCAMRMVSPSLSLSLSRSALKHTDTSIAFSGKSSILSQWNSEQVYLSLGRDDNEYRERDYSISYIYSNIYIYFSLRHSLPFARGGRYENGQSHLFIDCIIPVKSISQ